MPIHVSELLFVPDPHQDHGKRDIGHAYRASDGSPICGARLKRRPPELRCASTFVFPENGRCRDHSGSKKRKLNILQGGKDRWSAKLGRYRKAYEDALADDDISDMRRTLAALDLAVGRSAERMTELDTPAWRREALDIWRLADKAGKEGNIEALLAQMMALGQHLERGCSEDQAIKDFADAADKMSRRQEKFWGVRLAQKYAMNVEDVRLLLIRFFGELSIALAPERIRDVPVAEISSRALTHLDRTFGEMMDQKNRPRVKAKEE